MEIQEIFSDALRYPFQNIKALVIYLILGIILGLATAGTMASIGLSVAAQNVMAVIGTGFLGIIIALIISFAIYGFELDIVKYGIERNDGAPEIDFVRQFVNGVKLFVVSFIYLLIPIIIALILSVVFQHWLALIIDIILFLVFGLAAIMAECRLAKTEELGYALAVGDAIADISSVGFLKLLVFLVIAIVFALVLYLIGSLISSWNATVGGIILGIIGIYLTFFVARAIGLLYSDV